MKTKDILFIVSFAFEKIIGGHLISAIEIANRLVKRGYVVNVLTDLPLSQLHELKDSGIIIHQYPWKLNTNNIILRIIAHIKRIFYITVFCRKFDTLILMDYYAILHSIIAILISDTLPIQVVPGGKAFFPPINFPGIIVYSDELKQGLNKQFKIKNEFLIVSSGQLDFEEYEKLSKNEQYQHNLGFSPNILKILTASRLVPSKEKALLLLLDEVEQIGLKESVQLVIIGEGESKMILENRAKDITKNTKGNAIISFPGGFRVHPTDLIQADLVIGQGRTVMEAIACGIPASVCGNDGYKGLITIDTLPTLAPTNLTGRMIKGNKKLIEDIRLLENHKTHGVILVKQMAKDLYDADLGVEAIEQAYNQIKDILPNKYLRKTVYFIRYIRFFILWVIGSINYRIR